MRRRPAKASCTVDTTRANVLCTSQQVDIKYEVLKASPMPITPSTPGPTNYLSFRDIGMSPPPSSSANRRFRKAIEALDCNKEADTSPELRSPRKTSNDENNIFSSFNLLGQQLDHRQPRAALNLKSVPRRKRKSERVPTFVLELAEGSCEFSNIEQQPQKGRLSPPNVDHRGKAKLMPEKNPQVPTLELKEPQEDFDSDTTVESPLDSTRLSPPLIDCRIKAVMV